MSAAEVFNVDYHIELTDTPSGPCAEVTACLTMLNPESTMIIASLEVDAIEQDFTLDHVLETGQEIDKGTLPGAGLSDDGNGLSFSYFDIHVFLDGAVRTVCKTHVAVFDFFVESV